MSYGRSAFLSCFDPDWVWPKPEPRSPPLCVSGKCSIDPASRVVAVLLVESAVLAAAGVLSGLLLAHAGTWGLLLIALPGLPRLGNVELSVEVFAFAAVVAVAATMVLGIASGLAVTRVDLAMSFLRSLVAAFASLALLLSGVGRYGVMTSITASRTREMGIRMALSAGCGSIRRLIMRQGAMIAVLGLGLGFALAGVTTRWLRALLYDVNALDSATLVIAALSVLSITAAASYLPARRATKVDPTIALRSD